MPSLDGYSLNEKMDREFKDLKHEIEVLKFRIETEMREIREKFAELSLIKQVRSEVKQSKKVTKAKAEA